MGEVSSERGRFGGVWCASALARPPDRPGTSAHLALIGSVGELRVLTRLTGGIEAEHEDAHLLVPKHLAWMSQGRERGGSVEGE